MTYPEERYAKNFCHALQRMTRCRFRNVTITLEGSGARWDCIAKRDSCVCLTHCFSAIGTALPEYLIAFQRRDLPTVWGRTQTTLEALIAVEAWLGGSDIEDLYARFRFVDSFQRSLVVLREHAYDSQPALLSIQSTLQHHGNDLYHLWFSDGDRACELSYYGSAPAPQARFSWDESTLFEFDVTELRLFASVLKRWIVDRAIPSVIQAEYPWIQMSELAGYYESGQPILGDFLISWDDIEKFYRSLPFSFCDQVLQLITEMRSRGYDRVLRAGQSVSILILSRSRRHGLRNDQPCVAFDFWDDEMEIRVNNTSVGKATIAFSPEIDRLLRELAEQPIN